VFKFFEVDASVRIERRRNWGKDAVKERGSSRHPSVTSADSAERIYCKCIEQKGLSQALARYN